MDPITGALLAGAAAAAANETAKAVIKDAYEGLKAKVKQWFAERKRPDGEMALAMIEQKPDTWKGPLAAAVEDSGAAGSEALVQAAQELLHASLQESAAGRQAIAKYQVDARGAQIGVMGDNTTTVKDGIRFGNPR
jgi:hypothetical protein